MITSRMPQRDEQMLPSFAPLICLRVTFLRLGLLYAVIAVSACARNADSRDPAPASATVFTDSTLFRQSCLEADSGYTMAIQRCTPRDQADRPRRPKSQPPVPPPEP